LIALIRCKFCHAKTWKPSAEKLACASMQLEASKSYGKKSGARRPSDFGRGPGGPGGPGGPSGGSGKGPYGGGGGAPRGLDNVRGIDHCKFHSPSHHQ
jgi:hypothetical protein